MDKPHEIIKGTIFLTSSYIQDVAPKGRRRSQFKCSCGNIFEARTSHVISGQILGCGCRKLLVGQKLTQYNKNHKHPRLSHGFTVGIHKPIYNIWNSMKQRCLNPNVKSYYNYGGRGIKVCDRWLKFENFLEDMGNRPSDKYSLDRINNNGDYEPNNCKWATKAEQSRNTRVNKLITFNGKTQPLCDWASQLGIKSSIIHKRLKRGWTLEKAFTTPVL